MKKILVVEDDRTIVTEIQDTLAFHNFKVLVALDGKSCMTLFQSESPDLLVLDVKLPDYDGFDLCRKIRESNDRVPILMLTARGGESDKLLGFQLGADDYMTKPFSIKELVARIQALLKRSGPKTDQTSPLRFGDVEVNFKTFEIKRGNRIHVMSPKECAIFQLLVNHPNEVIHRDRIIDAVWGDEYFPSPRTVDNFILKLRQKIERDPKHPEYIITLHGSGYKLKLPG